MSGIMARLGGLNARMCGAMHWEFVGAAGRLCLLQFPDWPVGYDRATQARVGGQRYRCGATIGGVLYGVGLVTCVWF